MCKGDINCGWIDTKTGKKGAFDKNGNMRNYNLWEKFLNYRNNRKLQKELSIIKKQKEDAAWEYWGTASATMTYSSMFYGGFQNQINNSLYVNKLIKRAYLIGMAGKFYVDYNALIDSNSIVRI